MIDHTLLRTEIETDPKGLGLTSESRNNQVVALNKPTSFRVGQTVLTSDLIACLIGTGGFTRLRRSQTDIAGDVLWMLGRFDSFDFACPQVLAMIDALVAAQVFTAEDKAALLDLGTRPGSRSEELFGAGASISVVDIDTAFKE